MKTFLFTLTLLPFVTFTYIQTVEYAYLAPVTDTRDPILQPLRMSDCYDLCINEWKITEYGGRHMLVLGCANQCEEVRRRFASELVFEQQEHIRRYGKEYSPTLDGNIAVIENLQARLVSYYQEVNQLGGDYQRAFKRLDSKILEDQQITYDEFKQTLLFWNTGTHLGLDLLVFPRQYGNETFYDESFLRVIFTAGDTNRNEGIDYTEFVNFYDLLYQFDTTTPVTVFIRPKMLSKDMFGIVIEEVTY